MSEYVEYYDKWYRSDQHFKVGDVVTRITKPKTSNGYYSSPPTTQYNKNYVVKETLGSESTYTYVDINGSQELLYTQKIKLVGIGPTFHSSSFKLSKVNTMLQIEVNKPTLVQEFIETTSVDGDGKTKAVTQDVGSFINFDNLSAAKIYITNTISDSIRNTNTYRKFRVYQEVYVAQAKQPEVEFV